MGGGLGVRCGCELFAKDGENRTVSFTEPGRLVLGGIGATKEENGSRDIRALTVSSRSFFNLSKYCR